MSRKKSRKKNDISISRVNDDVVAPGTSGNGNIIAKTLSNKISQPTFFNFYFNQGINTAPDTILDIFKRFINQNQF